MTDSAFVRLRAIISKLAQLIDQERRAIVDRALDRVLALSNEKNSLLEEFENAVAALDNSNSAQNLEAALSELRTQAEENATHLKTLAAGVEQARARLKKINENELNTGAYRPDGNRIKRGGGATISAKI
ncbi:MAG: hypothetical protein AAGB02_08340 [Pseudomonadota bacterium]